MKDLQNLIQTFAEERMREHNRSTRKIYVRYLLNFNLFQKDRAGTETSWEHLQKESLVLAWVRQQGKLVNRKNLGLRLRLLRDFLEFLKGRNLIAENVVEQLYSQYPLKGWIGLAEAAKGKKPVAALEKLRPRLRFNGPWGKQMSAFILFKRRLGAQYELEEGTLANLDRYLDEAGISPGEKIPPALISQWLLNQVGNNEQTLHIKRRVAERFFDYARSLGLLKENPANGSSSIPRRTLRPYVFSKEEIREILQRARAMPDIPFFPHRGATYAMIFATLYCLGLRIGELCRLRLRDIDCDKGLLLIRSSKFYKSRLLPMGPKYFATLKQFVERHRIPWVGEEGPLFSSYHGKPMRCGSIGRVFRHLAHQIGLKPNAGQRRPCLHSFRHAFSVHRLLRWYRQGENVQAKLPFLSAFLGHVDLGSTQVYLDMIPELLKEIHLRFESHCGDHLLNQGGPNRERD
jgi:site-specific recombinase XerD